MRLKSIMMSCIKKKYIYMGLCEDVLGKLEGEVNKEHGMSLCEEITMEEVLSVIKSCKHNKTPGKDGLLVKLYVCMWEILGEDMVEKIYKYMVQKNVLSESMKGMAVLLYKKR